MKNKRKKNTKKIIDKSEKGILENIPMDLIMKRVLTIPDIERDYGIPRRTFNHYLKQGVIKKYGMIGVAEIYDSLDVDKLPHIGNSYTFKEAQRKYGVSRVRIMTAINNRKLNIAEYQMEKNRRLFQKDIEEWIKNYGIDKDDLHIEKNRK